MEVEACDLCLSFLDAADALEAFACSTLACASAFLAATALIGIELDSAAGMIVAGYVGAKLSLFEILLNLFFCG